MKSRSAVVVLSAALIGATTPGFANAGQRGDRDHRSNQSRSEHRDHGGNSAGLAIALGIGLLGLAAIASQNDEPVYAQQPYYPQPVPQQYGYGPGYNNGPGYNHGSNYGAYDGSRYRNRGYGRYGLPPQPEINPMTGY
jgi:hypothetical protein